jgi:hypothetical protein
MRPEKASDYIPTPDYSAGEANYTADPTKWAAPAPTNVQDALSRMEKLLKTLNSNNVIPL